MKTPFWLTPVLFLLVTTCVAAQRPPLSEGAKAIIKAATKGDKAEVERLLNADPELANAGDPGTEEAPLFVALCFGHRDIAELLIRRGASISSKAQEGTTILHVAAGAGFPDIVQSLIAKGANPNARAGGGATPLHFAAICGSVEAAKLLIRAGAKVNTDDPHDHRETPLHWAVDVRSYRPRMTGGVVYGEPLIMLHHSKIENPGASRAMVDFLIGMGANVNARDELGRTPLLQCASNGYPQAAVALLDHGASIEAADMGGVTPLRMAADRSPGQGDVARMLIARGAKVTIHIAVLLDDLARVDALLKANPALVNAMQGQTELRLLSHVGTPLAMAIQRRSKEMIGLLLSKGADVNGPCPPLGAACAAGDLELVKLLISLGADVNIHDPILAAVSRRDSKGLVELLISKGASVRCKDVLGRGLIHRAVLADNKSIIELLIAAGADVNAVDNYGSTPLHLAAQDFSAGVGDVLIQKGADVNAKDHFGMTPLHWTIPPLSEQLIAHGADINAKDAKGQTPMIRAASMGSKEEVRLLIEHGADVNASDDTGYTALMWAINRGLENHDLVELLVASGANVNAANKGGGTPLMMAAQDKVIADLLRSHGATK